jgi:hypothetical protein
MAPAALTHGARGQSHRGGRGRLHVGPTVVLLPSTQVKGGAVCRVAGGRRGRVQRWTSDATIGDHDEDWTT